MNQETSFQSIIKTVICLQTLLYNFKSVKYSSYAYTHFSSSK